LVLTALWDKEVKTSQRGKTGRTLEGDLFWKESKNLEETHPYLDTNDKRELQNHGVRLVPHKRSDLEVEFRLI